MSKNSTHNEMQQMVDRLFAMFIVKLSEGCWECQVKYPAGASEGKIYNGELTSKLSGVITPDNSRWFSCCFRSWPAGIDFTGKIRGVTVTISFKEKNVQEPIDTGGESG